MRREKTDAGCVCEREKALPTPHAQAEQDCLIILQCQEPNVKVYQYYNFLASVPLLRMGFHNLFPRRGLSKTFGAI